MSGKVDMEKVTVEVPKAVMDFLRKFYDDPMERLTHAIVDDVRASLDTWSPQEMALGENFCNNKAFLIVVMAY